MVNKIGAWFTSHFPDNLIIVNKQIWTENAKLRATRCPTCLVPHVLRALVRHKLRYSRTHVPHVSGAPPALCRACSRASRVLCSSVLYLPCVLLCLTYLVSYVPSCFTCLVLCVLSCLTCSLVSNVPHVLCVFTRFTYLVLYILLCITYLVPCLFS